MVNKSVIVEFVGLPCAGKSTLAHELFNIINKRGLHCTETTYKLTHKNSTFTKKSKKIFYAINGFIKNKEITYWGLRLILKSRQKSLKDFVKVTFNWCYICELVRRFSPQRGIHIFDQGIFQALWSIGYEAKEEFWNWSEFQEQFKSLLPETIIIINVEAEPEILIKRLIEQKCNKFRLQEIIREDILLEQFATAQKIFANIIKIASDIASTNEQEKNFLSIIKVANNSESEQTTNLNKIVTSLDNLLLTTHEPAAHNRI